MRYFNKQGIQGIQNQRKKNLIFENKRYSPTASMPTEAFFNLHKKFNCSFAIAYDSRARVCSLKKQKILLPKSVYPVYPVWKIKDKKSLKLHFSSS